MTMILAGAVVVDVGLAFATGKNEKDDLKFRDINVRSGSGLRRERDRELLESQKMFESRGLVVCVCLCLFRCCFC